MPMPTDRRKANGPASQRGIDGDVPPESGPMSAELTPTRLREVIERIGRGFYDRADVQLEVVRRLREHLPPA
jgi:hypothetical protein